MDIHISDVSYSQEYIYYIASLQGYLSVVTAHSLSLSFPSSSPLFLFLVNCCCVFRLAISKDKFNDNVQFVWLLKCDFAFGVFCFRFRFVFFLLSLSLSRSLFQLSWLPI